MIFNAHKFGCDEIYTTVMYSQILNFINLQVLNFFNTVKKEYNFMCHNSIVQICASIGPPIFFLFVLFRPTLQIWKPKLPIKIYMNCGFVTNFINKDKDLI